jgi:catechol 2,3-dioxygenase-like lactoylglutathione lyase family enzyme
MFGDVPIRPSFPASDLERAKRWYSEKLDLDPVRELEYGDVEYETGGVRFLIYQTDLAGTNEATAASFVVEDFDDVIAALRSSGVEFEDVDFGEFGATVDGVIASPDGTNKAAWFKDSEGNIFSVTTNG